MTDRLIAQVNGVGAETADMLVHEIRHSASIAAIWAAMCFNRGSA
ncbi:hypothetical protein [Mesorhizobium sp. M0133]